MIRTGTTVQNETIESLQSLFGGHPIRFTLVGSAACREYGLSRPAKDLDFVVGGYVDAMNLLTATGEYQPVLDSADSTGRTCTQHCLKTGVEVDFLTEGIRINDRRWLGYTYYSDPVPIPLATGVADVATLHTLIMMKVNAITSGLDTMQLGANVGGRRIEAVRKDIADVTELIRLNQLTRDLSLGHERLRCQYEQIFDRKLII